MKTWTTRDKRVLQIKDMEDSHIVNSIKMVRRNLEASVGSLLSSRQYETSQINRLVKQMILRVDDLIGGLEAEAKRRGLTI